MNSLNKDRLDKVCVNKSVIVIALVGVAIIAFISFTTLIRRTNTTSNTRAAAHPAPTSQGKYYFLDPQIEKLAHEAWLENKNSTSYKSEEEFRNWFMIAEKSKYTPMLKTEFDNAFNLYQKKYNFVKSSEILLLKSSNPPAWLLAFAAAAGTNAIIAMQADNFVNLHISSILPASTSTVYIQVPPYWQRWMTNEDALFEGNGWAIEGFSIPSDGSCRSQMNLYIKDQDPVHFFASLSKLNKPVGYCESLDAKFKLAMDLLDQIEKYLIKTTDKWAKEALIVVLRGKEDLAGWYAAQKLADILSKIKGVDGK